MATRIDLKHAAIAAVIQLETKLHFDRDHDGMRTLTLADCDMARAAVTAAVHVLPSIVRDALFYRVANAEAWLAASGARGSQE